MTEPDGLRWTYTLQLAPGALAPLAGALRLVNVSALDDFPNVEPSSGLSDSVVDALDAISHVLAVDKHARGLCMHEPCTNPATEFYAVDDPTYHVLQAGLDGYPAGLIGTCEIHGQDGGNPDSRIEERWHAVSRPDDYGPRRRRIAHMIQEPPTP